MWQLLYSPDALRCMSSRHVAQNCCVLLLCMYTYTHYVQALMFTWRAALHVFPTRGAVLLLCMYTHTHYIQALMFTWRAALHVFPTRSTVLLRSIEEWHCFAMCQLLYSPEALRCMSSRHVAQYCCVLLKSSRQKAVLTSAASERERPNRARRMSRLEDSGNFRPRTSDGSPLFRSWN